MSQPNPSPAEESVNALMENDRRGASRARETEDVAESGLVDVSLKKEIAARKECGRAAVRFLRGMCERRCTTCVT